MEVLKIYGSDGKSIMCKDGKVKITKAAGIFSSKREKVIPASNISGVEVKKPGGILKGYIQIQIAGQLSSNTARGASGGTFDAANDENSVLFTGEDNYKIAQQIQKHILDFHTSAATPASQISSADELIKFKQLLDEGVITRKEFDSMKAKLLSK